VRHLQQTLGELRFRRVVSDEPEKLRVHEYADNGSPRRVVWAVWSPSNKPGAMRMKLSNVPGYLISSSRMPLADAPATDGGAVQIAPGQIELEVDGSPVYLMLAP
jgi:hypothetical protein